MARAVASALSNAARTAASEAGARLLAESGKMGERVCIGLEVCGKGMESWQARTGAATAVTVARRISRVARAKPPENPVSSHILGGFAALA